MSPILMLIADTSVTFTATVVIAGISIVVGVLLLLILVFQLFGVIVPIMVVKSEKRAVAKAKKKAAKKAKKEGISSAASSDNTKSAAVAAPIVNTAPVRPAQPPVVEEGISGEVVAAIAAAVAATQGSGAVVRSIKRKNVSGRNPWAQAANVDNTRPF